MTGCPFGFVTHDTDTCVQAMEEIHKLRAQICNIVSATFSGVDTGLGQPLKPPNETQVSSLFSCAI